MELILQDDGNLILLRHSPDGVAIEWETHTWDKGTNTILWLQSDGSLSLRNSKTNELLYTSYSGNRGEAPYSVVMPDPGFLKIVDKNGKAVWSADQTQDFCKKSKRVTSNCESVGCTERMCRKKYTEFGATDTKLMRYYYLKQESV